MHEMNLQEIKESIRRWDIKRRTALSEELINYLNQGFCFQVKRAEFEKWHKSNPAHLHVYIGIFESKLKMFLIDSESDKKEAISRADISVKSFNHSFQPSSILLSKQSLPTNIHRMNALERSFRWHLYGMHWLKTKPNNSPIFQIISIPFNDYISLFSNQTTNNLINFFGLRNIQNSTELAVEMIVGNESLSDNNTEYDDLSYPIPPFSKEPESNFRLLIESHAEDPTSPQLGKKIVKR